MPIHDWSHAPTGLFHHFHQRWSGSICDALNDGRLPAGYFALVEQHAVGVVPDVLTLTVAPRTDSNAAARAGGGLAVADAPPKTRFISRASDADVYAARASQVVVRTTAGRVVSVVEVVSPGNKSTQHSLRAFVDKSVDLLQRGVNLLVLDLFPPSRRDPEGIHPLVWQAIREEPFELPGDKRLTLVAYAAGTPVTAYVEPVAVGDALPDMPLFLDAETYVRAPLEITYSETWARCPREFRDAVAAPTA